MPIASVETRAGAQAVAWRGFTSALVKPALLARIRGQAALPLRTPSHQRIATYLGRITTYLGRHASRAEV